MIIINGEPFIKLKVAVEAFFSDVLWFDNDTNVYLEKLSSVLVVFHHVNEVCDIYKKQTIQGNIQGFGEDLPAQDYIGLQKISGMCTVDLIKMYGYESLKIKLKISSFLKNKLPEFVGCEVRPISHQLDAHNYFRCCCVHLPDFLAYARDTDVEIDASFLAEIIFDDRYFSTQKMLSKKLYDNKFNTKEAANKYLQHFDGVLEETIIQACELASVRYDRINQQTKTPEDIAKDHLNKITSIFSDTNPTTENIEQFKSALPDVWQKALFDGSKEGINDTVDNKFTSNKGSTKERDNLFKTIGLLALAFVEQNKSNRFGSKEKPTIDPIAKELEKYLPENSAGLGNRAIRERLSKGVDTLKNC